MRVLFSSVGSLGDLYPLLSVAEAVRSRGVECVFAVTQDQVPVVERAGFKAMANEYTLDLLADDLGITPEEVIRRSFVEASFLFREVLPFRLAEITRAIDAWAGDIDLVTGPFQAEAARMVAEMRDVPVVDLVLQPMLVFDPTQPPHVPGLYALIEAPGVLGRVWNRWAMKMGMAGIRLVHGNTVGKVRKELGLPPHPGTPWFEDAIEPKARLGLYPEFLHDHTPHGNPPVTPVGYCPYDGPTSSLEPELVKFLSEGTPPIVFTLGSNAAFLDQSFFDHSIEAARALNYRSVVLTGSTWGGVDAGDDVYQAAYVPHQLLFPRAAAVVHHGGVGTCQRALAAGVPQFVVPHGSDQPDNAARMVRAGVARKLPIQQYTVARATALLKDLLGDPDVRQKADELAARITATPGADRAAEMLIQAAA